MDMKKVARCSEVQDLAALLEFPEVQGLIKQLAESRWTGRPGYEIRTMVGLLLVKSLFAIPTWTRTLALVVEHDRLREALDCIHDEDLPSIHAIYRFTKEMLAHGAALEECIQDVLRRHLEKHPDMGRILAIDGSDMPAYVNGMKKVSKNGRVRKPDEYSDPDAEWGHRSAISTRGHGGFYGFKLHTATCTETDLPVGYVVTPARLPAEKEMVAPLLDGVKAMGFAAETCAMDGNYDAKTSMRRVRSETVIPLFLSVSQPSLPGGISLRSVTTASGGSWVPRTTARLVRPVNATRRSSGSRPAVSIRWFQEAPGAGGTFIAGGQQLSVRLGG